MEDERANMEIEDEPIIKEYYDLRKQIDSYTRDMKEVVTHPNYCLQFMQSGRLVRVKHKDFDFGWGAVVTFHRTTVKGDNQPKPQKNFTVDVLLVLASDVTVSSRGHQDLPFGVRPPDPGEKGKMDVVGVELSCIDSIGHVRIFLPKDLKPIDQRNNVRKSLEEVKRRFPDGIAILDPIENMGITDDSFKKLLRKIEVLESRLLANPLYNSEELPNLWDQYAEKIDLGRRIKEKRKKINDALSVMQLEELKCRKRVLRRLNFINEADVVQIKARVACEISTGDELVLSELLFNGFFNDLTPEVCAACLSCFIFEEKTNEEPKLKESLARPFRDIQAEARRVAKMSQESRLPLNEEEYLNTFKNGLMEVVFTWCQGASFAQIWYGSASSGFCVAVANEINSKMTDVFEGNIIRLFRRLEELLRQMAQAARVMGGEDLEKKFDESLSKIKRDIVAAQSLYL